MKKAIVTMILAVMCGCNTVMSPFVNLKPDFNALPAEEMRALALEIEQAVQEGNRNAQFEDRPGLIVNEEAVLQAIRTRAARSELVNQFRSSEFGVEEPDGLIHIHRTKEYNDATTYRQRDRNALLVMVENNDRWAIYEGIRETSKLTPRALGAIQRIFYEVRLETLPPGQNYKDTEGNMLISD
ncbi:MAG: hypothetical protein KJ052_10165 [Candidatus Hydrogenedentes bacterium]|nr:hypothetical protein [Candidatus Hydrogenedentota bacterium]